MDRTGDRKRECIITIMILLLLIHSFCCDFILFCFGIIRVGCELANVQNVCLGEWWMVFGECVCTSLGGPKNNIVYLACCLCCIQFYMFIICTQQRFRSACVSDPTDSFSFPFTWFCRHCHRWPRSSTSRSPHTYSLVQRSVRCSVDRRGIVWNTRLFNCAWMMLLIDKVYPI